jgi:hypothetical protein
VATSQATTSTSYTDLTTSGPAVTVTISATGHAMVILTAGIDSENSNTLCYMGFAESGTNTASGTDTRSLSMDRTSGPHLSATYFLTGLTSGSTTFTAKYRSNSGTNTCTYADRNIIVITY